MQKEEFIILLLCCMIVFYNGLLENIYITVLPFVILQHDLKINQNITNFSIHNVSSIYNHNSSMDAYINKMMALSVSVKYIARLGFGPIPGILIDKYGSLPIIIVGLTIQLGSIIIGFFSYHRILLHAIMRIFDGVSLVCMNASSFSLVWIVFHTKGTHPIYLGILNMLYTFGTFVGSYVSTFINSYLGFIYLPIFTILIFSCCFSFWIFIFISSKRNQTFNDIIYKTATNAHDCKLENSDIILELQDQTNIESYKNNELEIILETEENVDNSKLINENDKSQNMLDDDEKDKMLKKECVKTSNESDKLIQPDNEDLNGQECDEKSESQNNGNDDNLMNDCVESTKELGRLEEAKNKEIGQQNCEEKNENEDNKSQNSLHHHEKDENLKIECDDSTNELDTLIQENNKEYDVEADYDQGKDSNNNETDLFISDQKLNAEQVLLKKPKSKYQKTNICSFFNFFRLLFNPYVFLCFLGIFTSQMSVSLFSSTITMWMIDQFKVSQQKAGIVWLPGSILSLIVPVVFIVIFKRWSKIRYLGTLVSAFIQGLGCIIMPFYPQYWNVAFSILFSVNNILMNEYVYCPMIFDIILNEYGAKLSGRSSIIISMAVSSGMLFGGLIAGPCVNLMGFKTFFIIMGVFYICVSLLNIIMKKYST